MRKKCIRVLLAVSTIFIMLLPFSIISFGYSAEDSTPKVDTSKKIYDYADLLSDSEEKDLRKNVMDYIEETNFDMVIVTISENNKSSAMAYADDFYDYNKFGIGDSHDGILFLIDMDNRKMWISTTGTAIQVYNSRIDSILDDCTPSIKNENYFECANQFIKSSKRAYTSEKTSYWIVGFSIIIVSSLLVPTIFCIVKKMKHKAVKLAKNADTYLDRVSIKITHSSDRFIRSHTSRTPRSTSSSSGGGGTHIGSSGISHGGGGRSF
ncbi:MAG: TPM domain-containing protein [Clostridia bacterium]|nr:TPM domain-containing protein [Clostridia bacterium]